MDNLSNGAHQLLVELYQLYLSAIDGGADEDEARMFPGSDWLCQQLISPLSAPSVDAFCRELARAGLLSILDADDCVIHAALTDDAIDQMSHRFRHGLEDILSWLGRFRGLLP